MGMVLGTRRKDARDADEPADQRRVPYRLASYEHDQEGKRFKSSNVVFSFWSAAKYTLILSLMLWWLPMFGQMIAGYVGGRRAGGPWKGVAASIVPVVGLYAVMTGFQIGFLPSHVFGVAIAPAAMGAALNHSIPFISPYLQFSSEYVGAFVSALAGASPYGINTYVLTVAFAYVGGVLAEQNRREIEYSSGAVVSNTTVLVHDPNSYLPQVESEKPHGVLAGVGALLHLPGRREYPNASGGFTSRGRGSWARAAEMRYADGEGEMDDQYLLPAGEQTYAQRAQRRRHHNHHHKDSWQNSQKRRGAQNFSAKPRFNYPQYQNPRPEGGYKGGMIRRSKEVPRFSVSSDPKSIKRAQRMIDHEWGGGQKKYPARFVDRDECEERGPSHAAVESEAVAIPRRKEHHTSLHQWDSI